MLAGVLMSEDSRASSVQPFIPVCVVKVPMGVNQVFDRIRANACKGIGNSRTSACKSGIYEELTVVTGKDGDISTSAHENTYVATQSPDSDRGVCCVFPSFLHETWCRDYFRPSKDQVWSQQPYGSGKASGCEKLTARQTVTNFVGHWNLQHVCMSA